MRVSGSVRGLTRKLSGHHWVTFYYIATTVGTNVAALADKDGIVECAKQV